MKTLWLIAGYACLILGLIGAVLPVMPTTVFILMAVYCFNRANPALANRLYHHPRLGPPLRLWQQYRGMTARTKITALLTMSVSFGTSLYLTEAIWLRGLLLGLWLGLGIWMWRLPTIPAKSAICATIRTPEP